MKETMSEMALKTDGDRLLEQLAALANPHRLRIIGVLHQLGPVYVSQLAREIGISRPLLHLHLRKLEGAGLVSSELKFSEDGKSLNFYKTEAFDLSLTPQMIAEAAPSLTSSPKSAS